MMITEIEDYFSKGCGRCNRFATADCATKLWAQGLATLRQICLSAGLKETVKWGHPCYMYADRNVAIIGAFRADFRLSFFDAALMSDPKSILEKPGPNTQNPELIRFTNNAKPSELEAVILAYLEEAKACARAGQKPPKDTSPLELPFELVQALKADPELSEAFYALTRGRQKSYVINLNSAKKSETKTNRLKNFRSKIIAGKGATER